jgi:hypothetical protein
LSELDARKEIEVNVQETNSCGPSATSHKNSFVSASSDIRHIENYYIDYLANNECALSPSGSLNIWRSCPAATLWLRRERELHKLNQYIEIVHGDNVCRTSPRRNRKKQSAPGRKRIYIYDRGSQYDLLMNVPSTYMWASPIPETYLTRYELVQRRCTAANHRYKDLLIYSKGYELSAWDKKFMEKLFESKNLVAAKEYC